MKKRCPVSGQYFEITDEELGFYERLRLPPPSLSPLERQRRRISFRNFRTLYQRECSATGKRLLAMYAPECPFPVFDNQVWWSDGWDPLSYGRDVDFSRPFFQQYAELAAEVPRFAIMNLLCENCEYSNFAFSAKNCYLVFGCVRSEECLYGHIVWDSKHCLDCLYAFRSEWCSHSTDIVDCYGVHYSSECTACRDSFFLHDCRNCADCFGCWNLRNTQYCIFNERCSRHEYEEKLRALTPLSPAAVEQQRETLAAQVRSRAIFPEFFGAKYEQACGNHIYESKGVEMCFDVKRCEDVRYAFTVFGAENSLDISFTGSPARFCVDCLTIGDSENVCFSHVVNNSHDIACSEFCYGCADLFGCTGLRNKECCILNKQYSPEKYQELRARIVAHMLNTGEWGEFFPMEISPFAYNESIVNEYYPMARTEVLRQGWRWRESAAAAEKPGEACAPPDQIEKAADDTPKRIFRCERSGKPYRIIAPELEFYRRTRLPLPRLCPDVRHTERMAGRFPRRLHEGACGLCGEKIRTAVPGGAGAAVYCEECYQKALYS
jgi:hypothetical protein